MCGIAGLIKSDGDQDKLHANVARMTRTLKHRGPDGEGFWYEPSLSVGLGHRRLAVVDLSENAIQPFRSSNQRWVISFNGEIYNWRAIRNDLSHLAIAWKSTSDTEVLAEALNYWGLEKCLERLVGMFAFAAYDRETQCLYLVRDRAGEKPLYYSYFQGSLAFASELKALRAVDDFPDDIDSFARDQFLALGFIPAPLTIYRYAKKVSPGHYLKFLVREKSAPTSHMYWNPQELFARAKQTLFKGSFAEAVQITEDLIKKSLRAQRLADVPVGAFLSGGIDSTLTTSLLKETGPEPVKTFSVGFENLDFDESVFARDMAKAIGTDHHELIVTAKDALAVVPDLGSIYDEPFADSSQIPTFLIAKFARQNVTVAISGDAGDEIFGGYNRYLWTNRAWSMIDRVPTAARGSVSAMLMQNAEVLGKGYQFAQGLLPRRWQISEASDKMAKLGRLTGSKTSKDLYRLLLQTGQTAPLLDSLPSTKVLEDCSLAERMMFWDFGLYLPDDILVKVDRAAMANSLEVRIPLLDYRLIEWLWTLPIGFKIGGGEGKLIAREILKRRGLYTPMNRPKKGFAIPVASWLKGALGTWAKDLLATQSRDSGIDQTTGLDLLAQLERGRNDLAKPLWNILSYLNWHQTLWQRN